MLERCAAGANPATITGLLLLLTAATPCRSPLPCR
jgi:hypothetical protein